MPVKVQARKAFCARCKSASMVAQVITNLAWHGELITAHLMYCSRCDEDADLMLEPCDSDKRFMADFNEF